MADMESGGNGLIGVEVVYAKPEEQVVVSLQVPNGCSVKDAIELSGLLNRYSEIDRSDLKAGVFGVVCKPEHSVKDGDRIEIYRPLIHDPKEARRQRALKK